MKKLMAKREVAFIATKFRGEPVKVNFYTRESGRVFFTATKKVPVKEIVHFKAAVKARKK